MKLRLWTTLFLFMTTTPALGASPRTQPRRHTFKPAYHHGQLGQEWARAMAEKDTPNQVITRMLGVPDQDLPRRNPHWGSHAIDIYRFHGNSFESAIHLRLKRTTEGDLPGRFVPDFSGTMSIEHGYIMSNAKDRARFQGDPLKWMLDSRLKGDGQNPVHSLLELQQEFPIRQMLSRGAVDPRTAEEMLQAESWLEPEQVTFFSVTETATKAELIEEFGKIPLDAEKMDQKEGEHFRLKRASSWVISGQNHEGEKLTLPAEKAGFEMDRETGWGLAKGAKLWELGRGAQTSDGAFEEAARQAILQVSRETFALKADPKSALILATAWDPAHAKVFRDHYGMTEVGKKDGKRLFVGRMLELAARANVVSVSEPLSYAMLVADHWSLEDGLRFLSEAKTLARTVYLLKRPGDYAVYVENRDFTRLLNLGGGFEPTPLWMLDFEMRYAKDFSAENHFSGALGHLMWGAVKDPFQIKAFDDLPLHMKISRERNEPTSQGDGQSWTTFLAKLNCIEVIVSSLSPVSMQESWMALVHALRRTRQKLRDSGVADPEATMRKSQIHFALLTADAQLGLEVLGLERAIAHYKWTDENGAGPTHGFWGAAFSVEQMLDVERQLGGTEARLPIDETEQGYYWRKLKTY